MIEISINQKQIKSAKFIEEIICMAILISHGKLPITATIEDAENYFCELPHGCSGCEFEEKCLASKIASIIND